MANDLLPSRQRIVAVSLIYHFASRPYRSLDENDKENRAPTMPIRLNCDHEPPSLRTFLADLPDSDLLRIEGSTPADYVPTALVLELEKKQQTPVVWFDAADPFNSPVVLNLFASRDRIARMVGAELGGFNEAWVQASKRAEKPVIVESGPVQENVLVGNAVESGDLPISRHFEADAGRYVGSGILVCKDPDSGVRNLSYQRLQLKDSRRFGASLHSRGHIWEHLKRSEELGRNLEVAVVIGVHPAINLAAAAKVAKEVDELDLACGLLGHSIELVRCQTIDLEVPAYAEYVLEGELLADTAEPEGPFGEYTGYSTSRSTKNVFVVKAITHRSNPVYHDIVPGYSSEHLLLSRSPREAHVFMRMKEMLPAIHSINYPRSGTHFHAYVSIKKTAEGQANHALTLLMGLDPYVKFAVAVDDDIDVFDEQEVLWALATRFQADTDLFVIPNGFCNQLDPSSRNGTSAKLGLDATAPLAWDVERAKVPDAAIAAAKQLLISMNRQ
ncbi:UbiD family decarboxylase [Natronocella acetinitrilica]|uniref:UbiD family decarboxylase n=1 Tax=Natronocella acetinitrilica TaxID=414046 RepID=A0AAE3KBB6_9GAMM|nr:UbiD family decarboxylase [Natronocella acetinitrilica]MCP1673398.1 UbiD family decarboxylase [Natronocella acetinitrilica]